jgi:putative ABC transport system permease protein
VIGLLEIRRRKVQFALIAVVVTLIAYLVLMINGLGIGLNELAGSALRNFNADAIAYSEVADLSVIRSELGQDTVARIQATQGVKASAAVGYVAANVWQASGKIKSAAFLGYDPGSIAEPKVTSGRLLTTADTRGLLADKSFLKATGLKVGDTASVNLRLTTEQFTIIGEIDQGAFFFQPAVYVLRDTWRELKYGPPEAGQPAASIVLLKGSGLTSLKGDGFRAVSKDVAFANIEGVAGQQSTVSALRGFGYLIGALVIGVFFYVLTLQKIGQIGVLKALGASGFYVFRQVLAQVLAISVVGVGIAVPLAWATSRALGQLPQSVPIAFDNSTFVVTSIALVVTGVVGALFSGRQVAGVDPIIALGQQQ